MINLASALDRTSWPETRKEIDAAVKSVLGKQPKNILDLQLKVVDEQDFPGYTRQVVNYFVDEWTRVSAFLFLPESKEVRPGIVCCHQQSPRGKAETAGLDTNPVLAFAKHYAERGYVTIAPENITAGERVSSGLEPFNSAQFYKDNPKMSLLGKMLWDHQRAVDILEHVSQGDSARIGVIGHDMGGYNALLLAALDDRVQVCVSSCGFTLMAEDPDARRWCRKEGLVLAPKLGEAIEQNELPFDWDGVLALAAPSPMLIITALNDEILPNTRSCESAVTRARKVYKMLGAGSALEHFAHSGGHAMVPEALQAADEWFERWL